MHSGIVGGVIGRSSILGEVLWRPEESEVESREHQDNADIHRQPFPESVSEEHEIYADYDGGHRHHVEHDSYLSAHSSRNRHFEFSITLSLPLLSGTVGPSR